MKIIATALLLLLVAPNLWALDSAGWWGSYQNEYSIVDAVMGLDTVRITSDGNLREMKVYLSVTDAHNVKAALYLQPDTSFVDSTEIVEAPVGTGWVTFKFVDSAEVYEDSVYCLLAWSDGGDGDCKMWYYSAGPAWALDMIRTYGAWPAVFNTIDNTLTYPTRIYVTWEPSVTETGIIIIINQ